MNNVTLIGRLVRDPELRYVPNSGTAVTNMTLAVDKGLSKAKKEELEAKNQPTADFIDIVLWGALAESSANYLTKGRLVAVSGSIQTGSYEDSEGVRRKSFEVRANSVKFLEWADDAPAANFGGKYISVGGNQQPQQPQQPQQVQQPQQGYQAQPQQGVQQPQQGHQVQTQQGQPMGGQQPAPQSVNYQQPQQNNSQAQQGQSNVVDYENFFSYD